MATLADIGVSAVINILTAFAFLLAFALLRIQPINDRVYFPKWYISGGRTSPRSTGNFVGKFVNLNFKTYLTFLNWMPQALTMSETEIINHAGLDSAAFLRIYTLGYCLKFQFLFKRLFLYGSIVVYSAILTTTHNGSEKFPIFFKVFLVFDHGKILLLGSLSLFIYFYLLR